MTDLFKPSQFLKYFILIIAILPFNLQAQKGLIKKAKKWYNKVEVLQTAGPQYENHWKKAYVIDNNTVIVPSSLVGLVQRNKNLDLYWFAIFEFNERKDVVSGETVQVVSKSKVNDVSLVLKNRKSDSIENFDGSLMFQDLKKVTPPRGIVYEKGVLKRNLRSEIQTFKKN